MIEPGDDLPKGQLFEEAAAWFARMRGPDSEASRGEFEAWLARGALHRSAYNRAAEIFAMGKLLRSREGQRRARRRGLVLAGLAGAAFLAGAAAWTGLYRPAAVDSPAAWQRSDGGRAVELASRSGAAYRLADGSIVTLAPASRLRVDIGPEARLLRLEAGEGRFKVAHEPRPFVVFAGGGSVTARGTIFEVALSADRRVRVRLIEGIVDVAVPGQDRRPRRQRLVAGQSTSFAARDGGQPGQRSNPAIASESAAGAGADIRDYDSVRLGELIEAAHRRSERPIRIPAELAGRRVSGRFRIDESDVLAERIAALFGLEVDRSDPSAIVLEAR
jgi:transmembrane sensor